MEQSPSSGWVKSTKFSEIELVFSNSASGFTIWYLKGELYFRWYLTFAMRRFSAKDFEIFLAISYGVVWKAWPCIDSPFLS